MVYTSDLGSDSEMNGGSSPSRSIICNYYMFNLPSILTNYNYADQKQKKIEIIKVPNSIISNNALKLIISEHEINLSTQIGLYRKFNLLVLSPTHQIFKNTDTTRIKYPWLNKNINWGSISLAIILTDIESKTVLKFLGLKNIPVISSGFKYTSLNSYTLSKSIAQVFINNQLFGKINLGKKFTIINTFKLVKVKRKFINKKWRLWRIRRYKKFRRNKSVSNSIKQFFRLSKYKVDKNSSKRVQKKLQKTVYKKKQEQFLTKKGSRTRTI